MFSYNYFKVSMARVQEDNNNDGQVQQDNNIVTQMWVTIHYGMLMLYKWKITSRESPAVWTSDSEVVDNYIAAYCIQWQLNVSF